MKQNLFDLTGEIAIVTGAAKGLGKGMAKGLAANGATVVIVDVDEKEGLKTAEEIRNDGNNAILKLGDITNYTVVKRITEEVIQEFGKIDILVNNAGLVVRKAALDTSEEEWDKVMNLNIKSHFLMVKAVLPFMMAKRKGKVIEIGSVSSFLGHPVHAAYAASKGAIRLFIKSLAQDYGKHNIYINGIAPGYIRTPMTEDFLKNEDTYKSIVSKIPIGRAGTPEDLVGPVVFLASKASDYVQGHLLPVEGGRLVD